MHLLRGGGDVENGFGSYLWQFFLTICPELPYVEGWGEATFDQCAAGLTNDQLQPIRKKTKLQGSVEETRQELSSLQCPRNNVHGRLRIDLARRDDSF